MKNLISICVTALAFCCFNFLAISPAFAQGTAFTYQGQLRQDSAGVNGNYDLIFTLFNSNSGGSPAAAPITNAATAVSNGVFSLNLDFGPVFTGTNYWLEIAVSTNAANNFSTLTPRQAITPAPYAIFAPTAGTALSAASATNAASATTAQTSVNFTGPLSGDVAGTQSGTVVVQVGGQTAVNIATGANAATAATSSSTAGRIVVRDGNGNFSAGTITASLNGNAATASVASNLVGSVTAGQLPPNIAYRTGGNVFSGLQQVSDTVILGPAAVDQQTPFGTGFAGMKDQWQSFTAGTNGWLTTIQLDVDSPLSYVASPGYINIYSGIGTNGSLLSSQTVTWGNFGYQGLPSDWRNFNLPAPITIQSNSAYTIQIGAPDVIYSWVGVVAASSYARGSSSYSPNYVLAFRTFVTPVASNAPVMVVNPADNSGYVGIGTNAPKATLHVAGNVLVNGTLTAATLGGNGGGLTNLSAPTLTGALPSISGANLTKVPAWVVTNNATGLTLGGVFNGNATTATIATSATSAGTAANFTGSLAGEVTGSQSATKVALIAGQNATNVANGANLANTASSQTAAGTLVKRDANGSFSAGNIFTAGGIVSSSNLAYSTNVGAGYYFSDRTVSNMWALYANGGRSFLFNFSTAGNTLSSDGAGNLRVLGSVLASTTPDLAETISAAPEVAAGDIVCADPNRRESVIRCGRLGRGILGVISDGTSGFIINAHANSVDAPLTGKPLVLAGRVPVKVCLENGPVHSGDTLAPSSTPGVAMRSPGFGPTIGIALDSFLPSTAEGTPRNGTVLCFVKPQEGESAALREVLSRQDSELETLKSKAARVDVLEKELAELRSLVELQAARRQP